MHSYIGVHVHPAVFYFTLTLGKKVDLRLRIVTVPKVQEEARRNGAKTKKNGDKSSNYDIFVTCVDVRCFL